MGCAQIGVGATVKLIQRHFSNTAGTTGLMPTMPDKTAPARRRRRQQEAGAEGDGHGKFRCHRDPANV
jgi:hypothetical protein